MKREEILDFIQIRFGALLEKSGLMVNDDILLVVSKSALTSLATFLKTAPELQFSTLMNHLGIDYRTSLAVVYNLYSAKLKQKITVKTYLTPEDPEIHSLERVFPGINWYERETYDLLGISFKGHSNLKRLLLPEDWEGYPLRKDYIYPDHYGGMDTGRADLLDSCLSRGEGNG